MKLVHHPEVTSIRQVVEVEIDPAQGISLQIQDLPPTYSDQLQQLLPRPVPPRKGPLRENGRIVRDEETGRIVFEYDEHDPAYLKRLAEYSVRQSVYFLTQGIVDGQVEFETQMNGSAEEYLDGVLEELEAFGWGTGQINRVAKAVLKLSNITEGDVERQMSDFSAADD